MTIKERGDVSFYRFWERGRTTIFDMRITDTDSRSYWKKEFGKVLEQHKKEKKDKYLWTCLEIRKDFTTMVFLVDGIAGCEARNAKRRLATHLASKWNQGYSQMVYYVRVRMAIAVVCANSLLIHGSRDQQKPWPPLIPDRAVLGDWQTRQDN
jgi:hypothetical protein